MDKQLLKTYLLDGQAVKNLDLPQYPDAAWTWITGAPDNQDLDLYSKVATVYRVANMTADAVSNLPFSVLRNGEEVDQSDDWQNIIGFMGNPRELIRLWRLSLFFTNSAYGFMEGNRAIRNLRYIVPTTIQPVVTRDGLTGFKRTVGGVSTEYSLKDNRIFYVWKLDHTTELLPSKHTEFKALMASAGVLYYADYYTQNFFQRGGIKPALLSVSGVPNPQEREKIESVWDKVVHGWYKYLGKVISADTMDVKVIGDGIDNLSNSALHNEKIQDIAIAAGMPLSLLLANSANYATAKIEYATWFRDKIVPDAHTIEDALNEQMFAPYGLKFEFRPEITMTGTEEEKSRAGAYATYVGAGVKPSIAAQLVGLDMPPNIEYEDLDEGWQSGEQDKTEVVKPKPQTDEPDEMEEEERRAEAEMKNATLLTLPQLRELEHWQDLAFRKFKQGKALNFPWVCKALPEDVASRIRERLVRCRTEEEIEQAFELSARDDDEALKMLADALNRAVESVTA
jgi:hypothetical protein